MRPGGLGIRRRIESAVTAERLRGAVEDAVDEVLHHRAEDLLARARRHIAERAIDPRLLEEALGLGVLPLEVGEGRRGEPVVVLVAADGGGEERVLLQAHLPLALEQVMEPRRLVGRPRD